MGACLPCLWRGWRIGKMVGDLYVVLSIVIYSQLLEHEEQDKQKENENDSWI